MDRPMGVVSQHLHRDLLALAENRLRPVDRTRAEAHMAACPDCRAEAADVFQLVDSLGAMPAALRTLTRSPARRWSVIWAQLQPDDAVHRPAVGAASWHLSLYMSLVAIAVVFIASVPAGGGRGVYSAQASRAQTPMIVQKTPLADRDSASLGSPPVVYRSTDPATRVVTPVPVPTPLPEPHG